MLKNLEQFFSSFGGEFITVGGVTNVLAGIYDKGRVAMFKFRNAATAEACFNSYAYKALWPLLKQAGNSDLIVFEEF